MLMYQVARRKAGQDLQCLRRKVEKSAAKERKKIARWNTPTGCILYIGCCLISLHPVSDRVQYVRLYALTGLCCCVSNALAFFLIRLQDNPIKFNGVPCVACSLCVCAQSPTPSDIQYNITAQFICTCTNSPDSCEYVCALFRLDIHVYMNYTKAIK